MAVSDDETAVDPSPTARPAGELAPGTVLNGVYRIEARLGAGGMGEVYRATNLANDEVDAIKIIGRGRADRTLIEAMFRKEARVLSRIHSPAVARLKLFMRDPALDLLYFVTDFVPGGSLLDRLKRQPASPDELRALMKRVLTGLQAVHEAGAVHRDLSPDNIILPGGDVAQAKIIDFGIAKELDAELTTYVGDGFAGKLSYIAPEQLGFSGAQIGPWTDLYSLALVAIAFAAGRPLDMGATVGMADEARRRPVDLSAVPEDLRGMFSRLLTYRWQARPATAVEVMAMIEAPSPSWSIEDTPAPVSVPAETGVSVPPDNGRRGLSAVIAWMLLAVGLGTLSYVLARPAGPAAVATQQQPPTARNGLPLASRSPSIDGSRPARARAVSGDWMRGEWVVDRQRNGCSFPLTIALSPDGKELVFHSAGAPQSLTFRVIATAVPTVETADYRYALVGKEKIVGTSRHGQGRRTLEKCGT